MNPIDDETLFRLIRPSGVSLSGDRILLDPALSSGQLDKCTRDAMLSMTPTQRAQWNAYWMLFVRDCEQRGVDVAEAVWGREATNDAT
jgi:hypothetical protein